MASTGGSTTPARGDAYVESTGSTSKKRAQQILATRQAAVVENRFDLGQTLEPVVFSDYAREYLDLYSRQNKQPQSYRRDQILVKHLKEFFGSYRLNDVQPMLVEHYQRKRLDAGRTPATVNREVACLKHIFNIAVRNGRATSNPVRQVKMLREDNEITRVLSRDDEEKLLDRAAPHVRMLVVCALETGMRLGEILALEWKDVDLRYGVILVVKTKTGKKRQIPGSDRLRGMLEEIHEVRSEGLVFSWRDGKALSDVKNGYKAALRRAGLAAKQYRFHDLRHTFATRLAEVGSICLRSWN